MLWTSGSSKKRKGIKQWSCGSRRQIESGLSDAGTELVLDLTTQGGSFERTLLSFYETKRSVEFQRRQDHDFISGKNPGMVLRRSEKTGNDKLPHVQAGARRAFLRQNIRSDQGLRMQLRQIQTDEAPRRGVRKMRRRGHSVQGSPRADGPHRAGFAGRPHLVSEKSAEQDRKPAGPDPSGTRKGPLLRFLYRAGPRRNAA